MLRQFRFQLRCGADDRTIEKFRCGKRVLPMRPGRIGSYHVPPNPGTPTTPRALSISTFLHKSSNQVILVPNLNDARVAKPLQDVSCRPVPICRQHWLPNSKDPDIAIEVTFKNCIYFGTALQTDRTGGREQEQDAFRAR